jgi:hypothetical protein
MFGFFGTAKSAELSAALDKTFKKFESMPASEFFSLAREHASGEIAAFSSACSGGGEGHVKELKFVFDSADSDMKSFTAFFSQKSTLNFASGADSQHPHPYSVANEGCAYIGVASVMTIAATAALCQAA